MPFTIDRTLQHLPLGFAAAFPRAGSGAAAADAPLKAWIGVTRHAALRPGAAAAALLPAAARSGAANRFTRGQLDRSSATWRGVAFVAASLDERGCGALSAASAAATGIGFEQVACVPQGSAGAGWVPAGSAALDWLAEADAPLLGELPAALRRAAAPGDGPLAAASTRGIVDGQLVSLFALASGRLPAIDRGPLRFTLLTDAQLASATLDQLLHTGIAPVVALLAGLAAPHPDDGLLALASGVAGAAPLDPDSVGFETLRVATAALTQALTRDLLEQAFAPRPAWLVQISVVGAKDTASAVADVEALAAAPDLAERLRVDRTVRRSRDGRQLAFAVDRRAGSGQATRWTALPQTMR